MTKVSLIFFFSLSICLNALYSQEKPKTLGILNLESANLTEVTGIDMRTLTNRLHTELSKIGRFQVVEMQKVEEILREQGLQQSGACETDQCVAEVGHLLGVEWMLTGYIGYIGATYSIDVRIIEVKSRKIVETAFENYRGKSEGLLDVMRANALKLSYSESNQALVGAIRITSQPTGATITINSNEAGPTPLTINDLAPGDYTIQGKLDGYLHRPITIQVNPGRIEQVDIKLQKLFSLKLQSNPSGARLVINGRETGVTPVTGPVLAGTYQIEMLLDGYISWKETIKVNVDCERKVDLTKIGLVSSKETKNKGKKKWPWIVAGVCVVGGGTVAAILLSGNKEEKGTLRVIIPQNF